MQRHSRGRVPAPDSLRSFCTSLGLIFGPSAAGALALAGLLLEMEIVSVLCPSRSAAAIGVNSSSVGLELLLATC